jgi:hypothetical protein
VDHSTLNRWVLAYAPLIEKRLRQFRQPHCGSIRIDETYIKVRGDVPGPERVRSKGRGIEAGSFPYSGKWIVCLPKRLQHPLVA